MDTETKIKKTKGKIATKSSKDFLKTFLIAFIIISLLYTPALVFFGRVSDYNPGRRSEFARRKTASDCGSRQPIF